MESIVFVNTTSSKCRARITGIDLPRVHGKLESDLQVTVKFFADGTVPALLDSPTFRVAFKATPTGAVLDMVTVVFEELADGYVFDFDKVTSPALLAAMGDIKLLDCVFEVEWTIDGEVSRAACPAVIENAFIRAADSAPNPADPAYETWLRNRALRHDEEQDLTEEQQIQAQQNLGLTTGAMILQASGVLSSNCLVHIDNNGNATRADYSLGQEARGLVRAAAEIGDNCIVTTRGLINGFTGLDPTYPYYLGLDGALTQTPPTTGLVQAVGVAITDTTFYLDIYPPVILAA